MTLVKCMDNMSIWPLISKDKRLCMSKYSLCELLVREAHKGSLMGHFRFSYI
jgi:hypothetical protein